MIAYFDCSSGISGDMILGALVDAGVSTERLQKELSCLKVKGYKLSVKKVKRAGLKATKVDVVIKRSTENGLNPPIPPLVKGGKGGFENEDLRKFKDIKEIVKKSYLSKSIKEKGLSIFKRLFEAEAKVHGKRVQDIHLHELGAVDCIVDIFGTLTGLDILGIDTVYSSPLNLGSGTVKTEHGLLPVPAPATVELVRGKPVYSSGIRFELTTPTGASLISSLATDFGSIPNMNITKIGIGAGRKNFKEQPNVLRLLIGQGTDEIAQNPPSPPFTKGENRRINNKISIIETNIDDMNPQVYEYVMDKLFKAGALDVFLTQVIMKKGRPGIKLTVLCSEDKKEHLIDIILNETTSIGLRFYRAERKILQREVKSVNTKFGTVNVKVSQLGRKKCKISVEYEDCKKIARKYKIPLLDVIKTVVS